MVNNDESQVKDEKVMPVDVDTESDLGKGKDDPDPVVGEDKVEDSSRVSEKLYQADQVHLRSLLPEELWYLILDILENGSPEDLRNLVNASPYFWELQREQRVISLFPNVFDILVKRYEPRIWFKVTEEEEVQPAAMDLQGQDKVDQENVAEKVDDDDFVEDLKEELADEDYGDPNNSDAEDNADDEEDHDHDPQDRPVSIEERNKKWKNALLTCRLVCKSWNKAIENCYARPEMSGVWEFKNDPDPRSPVNLSYSWIAWNFRIRSMRKAEEFIEHFSQSHHSGERASPKNPILGRYLWLDIGHIYYNRVEEALEILNTVSKILKMFGKEVWYTGINVHCYYLTADQYYLKFREWFCLMPNLKYLEFEEVCNIFGTDSPAVIAANPMPKLENILMINVNYRCGGTIINEVVRANGHVPHLKFWDSQIDEEVGTVLSNLSALSTDAFSSFDVSKMVKYGSNWKLKKASVDNWLGDFKGIFPIFENNWANTLTDLSLHFSHCHDANTLNGSKNARLNLPHISRLHLSIEDFILLDFILPLANTLEYLEIETWDPNGGWSEERDKRDAEGKDQTIQFAGFEEKMHQSNIWQIFKKLKTIKVNWIGEWTGRFVVYTRKGEKLVYVHRDKLSTDQ